MDRSSRLKISAAVVGVAVLAVGAGLYLRQQPALRQAASTAMADLPVPSATPVGITIQRLGEIAEGSKQGIMPQFQARRSRQLNYAGIDGKTFYFYDKDVAGMPSACAAECAKEFQPAVAPADAKPENEWSVVDAGGGTKQWARQGKRLYVSTKDMVAGELASDNAEAGAWHVARFQLAAELKTPKGLISVKEVADANGQGLVTGEGLTLYTFAGDPNKDAATCAAPPCENPWVPYAAAQMASPVGDFTVISRNDGIKQWAYKGRALYRFDRDFIAEDVKGMSVDNRFKVALVVKYFMPAEVGLVYNAAHGVILSTPNGMTLYRQDGYTYEPGGHFNYHSMPTRPVVGRQFGTKGCDGECLKTWKPVKAPDNAVSTGYWDAVARPDGTKQWAYQGFAQYTYVGDKQPGEMMGDDIYEILISRDPGKPATSPIYQSGAPGIFWTFTSP